MATKINPRRKPATQADVVRAYKQGLAHMMEIVTFTLGTDMEVSDEWFDRFHDRLMAHIDSMAKGYITTADVRKTTREEIGWETDLEL